MWTYARFMERGKLLTGGLTIAKKCKESHWGMWTHATFVGTCVAVC